MTFSKLERSGDQAYAKVRIDGEPVGELTVFYHEGVYERWLESYMVELDERGDHEGMTILCRSRWGEVYRTPTEARRKIRAWVVATVEAATTTATILSDPTEWSGVCRECGAVSEVEGVERGDLDHACSTCGAEFGVTWEGKGKS